jgi:hypothetical protein
MKNFTKDYNCFADAVPDLRLSLQMDWNTGEVRDFDHYLTTIQQCLK